MAASVIVHCFDGWSYLGRALEAEMAGDPQTAVHLGYYAELRAAMSVLASDGIGVFRNRHAVFTGETYKTIGNMGTHDFTWGALMSWADTHSGRNTLLKVIKPGSIQLREWLYQYSASYDFITTNWLQQWGFDLSRLREDRNARNVVSYRPTSFVSPGPNPISNTMASVFRFWEICEPGAFGGFPLIDRHLLRKCLALVSTSDQDGVPTSKTMHEYRTKEMVASLDPKELTIDNWLRFLEYDKLQDTPLVIKDANADDGPHHPDHSKQVLARATLLLRVATGVSEDLLAQVGPTLRDDLSFWWSSTAIRRRLWLEDGEPSTFSELWNEIDEVLGSVEQLMPSDHYTLWSQNAREASLLATTERVFLWGVGL